MSGYADRAMERYGPFGSKANFLQKPFVLGEFN